MTDRQTDGRTSFDGINRAMQSVARVKGLKEELTYRAIMWVDVGCAFHITFTASNDGVMENGAGAVGTRQYVRKPSSSSLLSVDNVFRLTPILHSSS